MTTHHRSKQPHPRSAFPALAVLLLLCAAGPLRAQVSDEVSAVRLAQSYEQAGKYEDALRFYQTLHTTRPMNSVYFDGLRRCLTALKKYDAAVDLCTRQLDRYPADPALRIARGGLFLAGGHADSADADWERAIALAPRDGRNYQLIAEQLLNARRAGDAVAWLRRGRTAIGAPQMFVFDIARACAMNMDFECAMGEYLDYLAAAPGMLPQIQQQLSQYAEIPEALDAAFRAVKRRADASPADIPLQTLLLQLCVERKDGETALAVAQRLDEAKHSRGLDIAAFAQRCFNDGDVRTAERAWAWLLETYPDAPYRAQAAFSRVRCDEALLDSAASAPAAMQPPGAKSWEDVVRMYDEVIRTWPDTPYANESGYRAAFVEFARLGASGAALARLEKVAPQFRAMSGRNDADILAGDIHLARGDADRALERYHAVLASGRTLPQERDVVSFKVAETFWFQGRLDTCLALLGPLADVSDADIANDALTLTILIQQHRKTSEALLIRYAAADYLRRQRRTTEAAAIVADILAKDTASDLSDQCRLTLGELRASVAQFREAADAWRDLIDHRPESILRDRAMSLLADLLAGPLRDTQGAITMYTRILTEYPNGPYAADARARIVSLRKASS